MGKEIKSEARLTFWESTGIIVGHGIGTGVLAVPYLASRNNIFHIIIVMLVAFAVSVLLHLLIAELPYNNNGGQFVECFKNVLFKGKIKEVASWVAMILLGLSVIMNCCSQIAGSAAVLTTWFGIDYRLAVLIYYAFVATIVLFGMKLVGICEKYSMFAMIAVIIVLAIATLCSKMQPLPVDFIAVSNIFALYGMISFSLSAVMSVPQVVKGLNGDVKKIRKSIILGIAINIVLVAIVTFITLLGSGKAITENGAIVDLAKHLGGWVSIVGYIFTLMALSTSLWANTLNLRDIVHEQTKFPVRISWIIASLPSLILAFIGLESFVGFARLASVIQVLTNLGIVVAYAVSRKKEKNSPICGKFGKLPVQIIVILFSLIATIGATLTIK